MTQVNKKNRVCGKGRREKDDSVVYTYRLRLLLTTCSVEFVFSLTACRKETKYNFPLQLTGAKGLGGTTLANRLAASRNYNHPCLSRCASSRHLWEPRRSPKPSDSCSRTAVQAVLRVVVPPPRPLFVLRSCIIMGLTQSGSSFQGRGEIPQHRGNSLGDLTQSISACRNLA